MRDKLYVWGSLILLFSGAGLAEHITSGRGSFPISAVLVGIGFVLICMSYVKTNNQRR